MIARDGPFRDLTGPQRVTFEAFKARGHPMYSVSLDRAAWPLFSELPDVMFTWNGIHSGRAKYTRLLAEAGVPTVILERGFFDRMHFCQVDCVGFNHTASWAGDDIMPCDRGREMLARTMGETLSVLSRPKGDILLLLQVSNDTQLAGAEINSV